MGHHPFYKIEWEFPMGNGKMMDFGKWEQGNKIDLKKKKTKHWLVGIMLNFLARLKAEGTSLLHWLLFSGKTDMLRDLPVSLTFQYYYVVLV